MDSLNKNETTVVQRIGNVLYWLFCILAALTLFLGVSFVIDMLHEKDQWLKSSVSFFCAITLFAIGWTARYILTGEKAIFVFLPERLRVKLIPILLIWVFWFIGVSLGQDALGNITNPLASSSADGYKVVEARRAGYSDGDISEFLSNRAQKKLVQYGLVYPASIATIFILYLLAVSRRDNPNHADDE